jgi:hypothetical protein
MRDIRASVEVRALIGADKLRELQGDAYAKYECGQCGRTGRTSEPTSVIVLGYQASRVIQLAHVACADSRIIQVAAGIGAVADEPAHRSSNSRPAGRAGGFAKARTIRHGGAWHEDAAAGAQGGLDSNPLRRCTDKLRPASPPC